jgi:NAD(P) transhydrogenase subunit alpha
MLNIGVLKESGSETRVSLIPDTVAALTKNNCIVSVELDAGVAASYSNAQYENAGAQLQSRDEILRQAAVLLSINTPSEADLSSTNKYVWIGVYHPLSQPHKMLEWAQTGMTAFSLDMLPRTTRAQAMDVLSSQANIAGYKAVLLAANVYPRYFPMFMTAAGSIAPAKVLILGAGVAGLQAIATAKRLGAVVEVFDTRPAVKEEVMSLGAKFVEVEGVADASQAGGYAVEQSEAFQQKQKVKIAEHATKADIIISTAQIPGRKAPILITREMMENMKAGSVIIDLAAATGGNTDFTKDKETVIRNGITIIGDSSLFATMPADASKMYSKNIQNFLKLLVDSEGNLHLNFEDDLVKGACIVHEGKISNPRIETLINEIKV